MEKANQRNGSIGESWKVMEQAKEELRMLETEHPDRFGHLKLELISFIFSLESSQYNQNSSIIINGTSSSATTQASTNRKRKIDSGFGIHGQRVERSFNFKERDRVDRVLEKAHSCLQKIRKLKSSL